MALLLASQKASFQWILKRPRSNGFSKVPRSNGDGESISGLKTHDHSRDGESISGLKTHDHSLN